MRFIASLDINYMALFGTKKTKDDKEIEDTKDLKLVEKKETRDEVKQDKKTVSETSMKDLYRDDITKKTAKSKASKSGSRYDGAFRVLIKPLVTEKATDLTAKNKYVFTVANSANKIEVAKAINEVYGVKAVSVNIISMKGKAVSRGKVTGQRKDWKKAIVSLKKGDSIKIYEGV